MIDARCLNAVIRIVPGALAGGGLPPQLELMAELAMATAAATAEAEPEPELEALAVADACGAEQGRRHHTCRGATACTATQAPGALATAVGDACLQA